MHASNQPQNPPVHLYYVLGEEKESFTVSQKAEYTEIRREMVRIISKVRNSLYDFMSAITFVQYPGGSGYSIELDSFEVLVASQTELQLFGTAENNPKVNIDVF